MEHPTKIDRPTDRSLNQQKIEDLRELIAAVDRRVPRLERAGEVRIARDAAALRREALERIADIRKSVGDE